MRVLLPFALSAVGLLGLACSSANDEPGGTSGSAGTATVGSGGSAGDSAVPRKLEIQDLGVIEARAAIDFTVRAQPPGVYKVQLSLPSTKGDPLDAVLDRSEVETDADGLAHAQLTTPSSPTTFALRASVGSVVATQTLILEDGGVATVQVEPRRPNLSALRDITTWIASAHADKTCAELPGIPPEDGPFPAPVAGKTDAPIIPSVPAGKRLAITLRSGHFIGGCTTVESLPPGPVTSPQVVVVSLLNRPIDLSASYLTLSFGLDDAGGGWQSLLTEAGERAQSALLGSSADDVDAILDAMREASGDSRQAFENARTAELWDDALRARWGAGAATKVRDLLGSWLVAGRARFAAAEPTFRGSLSPLPQSTTSDASAARLELSTVASVSAATAGFAQSAQVSWSASPDDTVALATDLYFVRSRLATALAEGAALDASPSAANAASALAEALDCSGIAVGLAQAGVDTAVGYGTCTADCLAELCEGALTALWSRAGDAEGLTPTRLSFTATGKAYVGDDAEIAGLTGAWIGELEGGGTKVATRGPVTAATPLPVK
ncbi:MAG: hypothetical protein EOO73_29735 [Myxococcales bacterium]|nr:MAG: hypothetical protein EOO73_29735 [Myxococcales bacterium]